MIKPLVIESKFITKIMSVFIDVYAITLFPFVFTRDKSNKIVNNHESIHAVQQLELLIIPFYIIYALNFLINLVRYKDNSVAYENIVFEKEAYNNEKDFSYLEKRKFWAWCKKRR